jgi:hypothetical protein
LPFPPVGAGFSSIPSHFPAAPLLLWIGVGRIMGAVLAKEHRQKLLPMQFVFPAISVILILSAGVYICRRFVVDAGRRKLGMVLLVLFVLGGLPSFFSVVSFAAAEPASVIRANGYDVPPDWTAGVMNHGSYYRWYMIRERPVFFGLSVIGLILGVVPLQALLILSFFDRKK